MPTEPATVSLVAVNFNGEAILERFLASVAASDLRPAEVVVVDNASTDGSVALLAARDDVRLVASPENLGFGRGCNLGAEHATGDLLLFANPDVELRPDTVAVLAADVRATPGAAIACATLLEPGYTEHEREARVEDVAAMAAAVMLVDREHFEALGGFDPWMFLYWEDTDLCYRTWLAGRRVLKSYNAVAAHDLGGAGGGHAFSGEQIKNGLYVHLKARGWPATARFAGRMAAKTAIRGVLRRDASVLRAWTANLRELRTTLAKRRALRGTATPADRARLERLGAEHAYWQRRSWRAGASARVRALLPGG
jgi:GT2 family glycosyltransferase